MSMRAASIEYDIVGRPAGLPGAFAATAGTTLQFLVMTAIDGTRSDAALWQPAGKAATETALVIQVHGSGSNYWQAPNGFLGPALAAAGRAVLTINTRQHDDHVATENFFDVRRDLEAAV